MKARDLRATITPEGRAIDITIVKGPGLGLGEAAIEAVKSWKFQPAVGPNGRAVASSAQLEIQFR